MLQPGDNTILAARSGSVRIPGPRARPSRGAVSRGLQGALAVMLRTRTQFRPSTFVAVAVAACLGCVLSSCSLSLSPDPALQNPGT